MHWESNRLKKLKRTKAKAKTQALAKQVGGKHYKGMAIQPVEYMHANNIGFIEGAVIKYISRWRSKGGISDVEKAKHFCEILIELEQRKTKTTRRKK